MNVSVPAWATDQQYLYLANEGVKYQPDYVVLMVAPNDIRESYGKKFLSSDGERLVRNPLSLPWKDRLFWFLANHSCAFQYWQRRTGSEYGGFSHIFRHFPVSFPLGSEQASDRHLFIQPVPSEMVLAKELFKSLLTEIRQLCNDNGSQLLLAIIPTKMEYDGTL